MGQMLPTCNHTSFDPGSHEGPLMGPFVYRVYGTHMRFVPGSRWQDGSRLSGPNAVGENMNGRRPMRTRGEKMSLYLPGDVLEDIRAEARRQQRSVSWLVRNAWRLARRGIDALPEAPDWGKEEDCSSLPNP